MANEYLQRTPTSTGNTKVFTWSGWVKKNEIEGGFGRFFESGAVGDRTYFTYTEFDEIRFTEQAGSANRDSLVSNYKLRDSSSLCHVMIAVDTTLSNEDDRVKIYINGSSINNHGFSTNDPPGLNAIFQHNESGETQYIGNSANQAADFQGYMSDVFHVDGQALTPDVFGYYKDGAGYISVGSTLSTSFKRGQWVPKKPSSIKAAINAEGGFGVNGYYLPINDSSNMGADFHCDPNTIITLKGENNPQPRNGAPTTTDAYVSQLRTDPYAANLVLAIPGISGGQGSGYGDYSADIKGSGTNKTIIPGNVSIGFTGSYYGSALTGFSTDPATFIQNHEDFRYGSDDFTVEGWIYVTDDTTGTSSIISLWNSTDARRSWAIFKDSNAANGGIRFVTSDDGTYNDQYNLDPNASLPLDQWNHFAVEKEGNTGRVYQNGVCVGIDTNFPTTLYSNNNDNLLVGAGIATYVGSNGEQFTNGYIQDLRVYKGVAKYKGGFDVPKPYTPVGIGTWRAVPDTTANNFATMSPLIEARPSSGSNTNHASSILTFADGNLSLTNDADSGKSQRQMAFSSVGFSTGKWYYEQITGSNGRLCLSKGIQQNIYGLEAGSGAGLEALVRINAFDGVISIASTAYYSTATPANLTAESFDTTNVMGVSVDASLGKNNLTVQFYKDGVGIATLTGIGATSPVEEWFPTKLPRSSGTADEAYFNFGQNPTFSGRVTAGTYTDSNGKGLFKYEPPSGFLALCEDNLPTPAIADPGEHFKTVLYTGDNSEGRSITGVGFKPDLIWFKARNSTASHVINDTVRGVTAHLNSNTTADESIPGFPYLNSVDSDGFSLRGGTSSGGNISGRDMVAWCWRAGAGTTTANTSGSIPSVVSVNQDAGFSIVSYTGDGNAGATFGHGLGKTPGFIIVKRRDSASQWNVWTSSLTNNQALYLNLTNDVQSSTTFWNDTDPNSSVITLGTDRNVLNGTYIAYCWTEIEGFSKFGSYVGNGNADGPFVYCGFKPAWLIIKNSNASSNWFVYDSVRDSYNMVGNFIRANINDEEGTFANIDFLSNGFKFRDAAANNSLDQRHIFAAFAESPFQTANAK